MPAVMSVTEARAHMRDVFSDAVQAHRPVPMQRNQTEVGVLLGAEELLRLVAGHEFRPEVSMEPGAVNIWLPELTLYGRGRDFDAAQEDLLDEVRDYVDEYVERAAEFLRAPNRAHHYPFVLKALVADLRGELEDVLFAEPSAAPVAA